MQEQAPVGAFADPSARVLTLPLMALKAGPSDAARFTHGLPAPALDISRANLVVAATPCSAPMFIDVVATIATQRQRDVVLVRTGLFPETIDPVTADVALCSNHDIVLLRGLLFFRHADGGLWLVPESNGAFVRIGENGLHLSMEPPYLTWCERSHGLCAAAAEIVRLATKGRVR